MTDLCLGCDEKECICLEVHEGEFDMNKNLVQPVHSTNLVPGQNYILDHLFGKGVQVEIIGVERGFVNIRILRGMMCNGMSKQQWLPGKELEVSVVASKFYEVQG